MEDLETLRKFFVQGLEQERAAIFADSVGANSQYRVLTLTLDTAVLATRPFKVGFPFKSLQVYDATNSDVTVFMKASTQDDSQDWITLKLNNSIRFTNPVREAYLYWTAQASKTLKIIFFLNGEFATNQFVQVSSGGFTLADGTAVAPQAAITATASATQIFASSATRKMAMIQNNDSIPVFISGDNTVTIDTGAFPGIKLNPGESYEWRSSSACFLIAGSAGATGKIGLNIFT